MKRTTRIRLGLVVVAVVGSVATLLWLLSPRFAPDAERRPPPAPSRPESLPPPSIAAEQMPHANESIPPADSIGTDLREYPGPGPVRPQPDQAAIVLHDALLPETLLDSLQLLIPVAGIRPENLSDTYNDARSEGRIHNAIDIMAQRGTPVLAAADGSIARLFSSERGGLTIYQHGVDARLIYYYAHLDHYADGIAEGTAVRRGDVIAYVGNTGNAAPDAYHLHFAISIVSDPSCYWDGIDINPYPILRRSAAAGNRKPGGAIR